MRKFLRTLRFLTKVLAKSVYIHSLGFGLWSCFVYGLLMTIRLRFNLKKSIKNPSEGRPHCWSLERYGVSFPRHGSLTMIQMCSFDETLVYVSSFIKKISVMFEWANWIIRKLCWSFRECEGEFFLNPSYKLNIFTRKFPEPINKVDE